MLKKLAGQATGVLATEPSPQRGWPRRACPNCGAPVEFRSAASAFAVCSYCRSTHGARRRGAAPHRAVAELFDDHSPLQLARRRFHGWPFTLVGGCRWLRRGHLERMARAVRQPATATRSGWLSEDNGAYVFAFDAPPAAAPPPTTLRAGRGGRSPAALVGGLGHRAKLLAAHRASCLQASLDGDFCRRRPAQHAAARSARSTTAPSGAELVGRPLGGALPSWR